MTSEAELDAQVRAECEQRGILRFTAPDARRCVPGWPDLVLIGRSGILFRELKAEQGRLAREQWSLGKRIEAAGGDWAVWRPVDLASGLVLVELDALAAVRADPVPDAPMSSVCDRHGGVWTRCATHPGAWTPDPSDPAAQCSPLDWLLFAHGPLKTLQQ